MYITITPSELIHLNIKCEDECGITINYDDVKSVIKKLNLNPDYDDFDYDGNLIIVYNIE